MSERAPMQDTLGSDGTYQATLSGVEPAESESDPRYRDEQWLREQYVEKELSTTEIAEKSECSARTVSRRLRQHGIERRGVTPDKRLKNAEWLREQYIEERLSTTEIAEKIECSQASVSRRLRQHGIETRERNPISDKRLKNAEWLREQYIEERLSTTEIAEKIECSQAAVSYRLRKHGIETRAPASELSGKKHPAWNGGPAPYGPGWNESKRRQVRERDNHTCQDPSCDITQSEHRERHGEKLHVHHLQKARDVDNPEERNAAENLVTLCCNCHQRWEKMADAGLVPEVEHIGEADD